VYSKNIYFITILFTHIFLFLFVNFIFCFQPDNDRSQFYDFGKRFYSENIILPTNTLDSIDIVVLFRFSYSLLLFQKNSDNSFSSLPNFEFELKNSAGIIKKRIIWTDTILIFDYKESQEKMKYRFGYISSRIKNDDYNIFLNARNKDNSTIIKQKISSISKLDYKEGNYISQPLFLYQDNQRGSSALHPFILDGNISFSSKTSKMVLIATYRNNNNDYYYFVTNSIEKEKKDVWDEYINFSGQSQATYATINVSQEQKWKDINISIDPTNKITSSDSNLNFGILDIELFSEQLVPGQYSLILVNTTTKDTIRKSFQVEWEHMPLALKKPKYALSIMYYILTDSEYDAINIGSDNDIMRKIIAYWKKQDPTPFSPYNEAMVEYFTRADYAFFNFQTISEKDGAKTDRGKIYILYGPPDKIERKLVDSDAIEIWYYKKLIKEFYFQTKSTGVFKLIKINE